MLVSRWSAVVTFALALSACELQRTSVGGGPDVPPQSFDAGWDAQTTPHDAAPAALDAGPRWMDAGAPLDAGPDALDAGPEPDAGLDAGAPDTGVDACAGSVEHCDGRDEDCDGRVDEEVGDCGCDRVLRDDGRSYLFCTSGLAYDASRTWCNARGYDLVVIGEDSENAFVRTETMARGSDFTLGLDDRTVEREFRWVDGSLAWDDGTALLFVRWQGGQPDDYFGEDCVQMRANGSWNDVDCDDSRRYVCESPPP